MIVGLATTCSGDADRCCRKSHGSRCVSSVDDRYEWLVRCRGGRRYAGGRARRCDRELPSGHDRHHPNRHWHSRRHLCIVRRRRVSNNHHRSRDHRYGQRAGLRVVWDRAFASGGNATVDVASTILINGSPTTPTTSYGRNPSGIIATTDPRNATTDPIGSASVIYSGPGITVHGGGGLGIVAVAGSVDDTPEAAASR